MIYLFAIVTYLMPTKKLRNFCNHHIQRIAMYWIDLMLPILYLTGRKKWDLAVPQNLIHNKPYLLISNHTSWIDILVLSIAFHRKAPALKFFMKKQLLWSLPFAGLATWLLKYPFMERHTKDQIRKNPDLRHKDLETTKKACALFATYPATVMNYVEGTRFTEEKRINKNSPYKNLLPAKSAGIAIVLYELQHKLMGILDATVCYTPSALKFWHFCCGDFEKIYCHAEILPITEDLIGDYMTDREFRKRFQNWLNIRWQKKDNALEDLKTTCRKK